ncbi:energy transducer TonB [Pseudoalteromonas xiamenensis]|uniref:energy transducer TonB n=1 Tax=Pseudoalteromonas xiamenensis TaxID=882626 RepID=UPI0027E595DA|nr:energy transducer TonB [Pseudoalteromonas xiamenensis]WMN60940.1 energy transducer TonB [Pseudoalteromonas xiamenensis]
MIILIEQNAWTKPVVAISGAIVLTLATFALMQHLISQDNTRTLVNEKMPVALLLSAQTDSEVKKKSKVLTPPPRIKPMPPRATEVPEETSSTTELGIIDAGDIRIDNVLIRDFGQPNNYDANPIVRITPNYPLQAARDGLEGWVKLSFSISEIGAVVDANVIASEPAKVFDREALKALKRWKYRPKVQNGSAVIQENQTVVLEFSLSN